MSSTRRYVTALAWKVAGYYGVDRYLLPMLGTPSRGSSGTGRIGQGSSPG